MRWLSIPIAFSLAACAAPRGPNDPVSHDEAEGIGRRFFSSDAGLYGGVASRDGYWKVSDSLNSDRVILVDKKTGGVSSYTPLSPMDALREQDRDDLPPAHERRDTPFTLR